MKRRILLLMMTALLSVGAGAQSLWTKTLFEGSQEISSSSPLTIAKTNFQGAREGSLLTVYLSAFSNGDNLVYCNWPWRSKWANAGQESVSFFLDSEFINASVDISIYPQDKESEGHTGTVTKVTLSYNGVNLITSADGWNPGYWGTQLSAGSFTNASEGDILAVSVKSVLQDYKALHLQNGNGDATATTDKTLYNSNGALTDDGVTLDASYFTGTNEIVVGDIISFTGTEQTGDDKHIYVYSNGSKLTENWWYTVDLNITSDNIETIKAYGVVVTGNAGTLSSVVKKSAAAGRPTSYYNTSALTAGETLYITLTSDLVAYAKAGNLYLAGKEYTASSVDLIYQPSAVNIGSTGYATFGYPAAVDLSGLSASQDAYTVTVSGTKARLTSVKGKRIPAGTGIILKGTNGNAISLPLTTESTVDVTGNELLVSDGTVTGDEKTIYVLADGGNGVGFYLLQSGDKLAAGKAYLSVSDGVASARQFIGFGDGNETTGIQTVANSQQSAANSYYDLQGRRVAQPTKGLYIVNGKKVIIK